METRQAVVVREMRVVTYIRRAAAGLVVGGWYTLTWGFCIIIIRTTRCGASPTKVEAGTQAGRAKVLLAV